MKMRARRRNRRIFNGWILAAVAMRRCNKSAMRATFIVIYDMRDINYENVTGHARRFIFYVMIAPFLDHLAMLN